MQNNLNQVLQRLQAATDSVCRLQQREQERKKIHNDLLIVREQHGKLTKKRLPPTQLASASRLAVYSTALFCRKTEPSPGAFAVS